MDAIESAMHAVGVAFVAGLSQPGSIRASVGDHGHQSRAYDTAGDPAMIGRWGSTSGDDLHALLRRLRSATAAEGLLLVEVTGAPAGNYTVSFYIRGAGAEPSSTQPVVLFDPYYRLPDHPGPGMARPSAVVNDGRPTDPAVLDEVQRLVAAFTAEHTRVRRVPPQFVPGYSEQQILAGEQQFGVRLPEDLRALYRTIHNDWESGLLGPFSLAPLEQLSRWYRDGEPGSGDVDEGLFTDDPVVFETHPQGHVRRVSRSDWWVTFGPDLEMNYAAVDLDPAPSGQVGQILQYGRDVYGPVVYVASSIRQLMRTALEVMRGAAPGDEPAWQVPAPPDHAWYADVGLAALADLMSDVDDRSAVQLVHVRDADRVWLTDLAGLDNLRTVRVRDLRHKAAHVDLSLPHGAPVEQVDVTAMDFDPQRLAGTPSLRYVSLAGNTAPVQVAALAALPDLVRLDLSGADVADVAAVATFPALRVLVLNAGQWQDLLSTGWTPQRLAAARLDGPGSIAAAPAWYKALHDASQSHAQHRTVHGPR